jgi:PAS domain S-box-containing protein
MQVSGVAMTRARLQPPDPPDSETQRGLKLTCLRNLLSAAEERVYFKDRLSRFMFVSEGWLAAYTPGRTAADLIGKTDFDVFSDQHASAAFRDEKLIIRTGEPIVGQVERETYAGRADAWVSTTKMPLLDSAGEIIGTFGISRDITAQVQAEKALADQALELSVQNEQLRELDRLKDQFIALVSHELRTPLTSIIGYIKLLRDERTSAPNAAHFTEIIQRNAERLLRLVGDLLFLSQLQSGTLAVELRPTDLAEVAARAVTDMRAEAERKHIGLDLLSTEVPTAEADPARIGQLLGNLLANALKFTPDGGRVEVRLHHQAGQAMLAVSDTGPGIPAADQEQIFERFFRTAAATRQAIPGTGLGLTISKAIVDAHHGSITVDSAEGQGTVFTVRLPLRQLAGRPLRPVDPRVSRVLRGPWPLAPAQSGRPGRRTAPRCPTGPPTGRTRCRLTRQSWPLPPRPDARPRCRARGRPGRLPPRGPSAWRPRTRRCPALRCPTGAAGRWCPCRWPSRAASRPRPAQPACPPARTGWLRRRPARSCGTRR